MEQPFNAAEASPQPSSSTHGVSDDSIFSITQPYIDDGDDSSGSGRDSTGPDEAVFDDDPTDADIDTQSSAGTSRHSECNDEEEHDIHSHIDIDDDDISELPPDSRRTSCDPSTFDDPGSKDGSILVTPQKHRSAFRNPSSVRAMQLDTTPPHLLSSSRRHHIHRYRMSNNSQHSTPRSSRSFYSAAGPRNSGGRSSPTRDGRGLAPGLRKEYPLVLLHVSLLPVVPAYSAAVLESVLPAHVVQSWNMLQEKVTDTVLERGILIPHPREDYGLLEERLLESLELREPRILKCGHFHLTTEEKAEIIAAGLDQCDEDIEESSLGAGESHLDVCEDCGRRVLEGRFGTAGLGQQRWSIKVYASNGLMRAGAWGAAWHEMESVDVEVLPWLDEHVKRELDLRRDEELAHAAMRSSPAPMMDEARRREIYGEEAPSGPNEYGQHQFQDHDGTQHAHHQPAARRTELPLPDLLLLYGRALLQDRRNLTIILLSVAVMFMAISAGPYTKQQLQASEALVPSVPSVQEIVTHTVTYSEATKTDAITTVTHTVATTVQVAESSSTLVPEPSIGFMIETPLGDEAEITAKATTIAVASEVKQIEDVAVTPMPVLDEAERVLGVA